MRFLITLYNNFIIILNYLSPMMTLIIRLWIAQVFWASGILKIQDFSSTIELFTSEHPVPFLPPLIAAIVGTTFELACPILLTFGLATRLATLPLLAMTAVIQITYDQNIQHLYWAMLLGVILFYGAGKISLDYLITKKYNEKYGKH